MRRFFGLATPFLVVALIGCGQQPATTSTPGGSSGEDRPPAGDAAPAASAPRPDTPPEPAPAPPAERPPQAPSRAERPASHAKAVAKSEPVAETSAPATPPPPAAPPVPRAIVKTLPAGTPVDLIFMDGLSSETSRIGDPFRARVAQDIRIDGMVVVPAGSVVHGEVGEVTPMKKIGGTAKLVLSFSRLDLTDGSSFGITAAATELGKSQTKKDAATIGGAAAGGAVLGKLIGKGTKEALIGAVVGAGVGTAVAAKNKGEQVEIPVGTQMSVPLGRAVDITFRP